LRSFPRANSASTSYAYRALVDEVAERFQDEGALKSYLATIRRQEAREAVLEAALLCLRLLRGPRMRRSGVDGRGTGPRRGGARVEGC
jgi:hypothetical protein